MGEIPGLLERIGPEHSATLKQCLTERYREICRREPTEQTWGELLALVRLTDALGLDCEELYHGAKAAPVGGKA